PPTPTAAGAPPRGVGAERHPPQKPQQAVKNSHLQELSRQQRLSFCRLLSIVSPLQVGLGGPSWSPTLLDFSKSAAADRDDLIDSRTVPPLVERRLPSYRDRPHCEVRAAHHRRWLSALR